MYWLRLRRCYENKCYFSVRPEPVEGSHGSTSSPRMELQIMAFWVYILRCADDSYYTGHTDNLEQRIAQHNQGYFPTCYTYKRRPLTLVFSQDFVTREEALASEQQIKGWSRKKKEAMMRGDWAEVSRLAKSPTPVRGELANIPVRGELVEPQHVFTLRQAQGERGTNKVAK